MSLSSSISHFGSKVGIIWKKVSDILKTKSFVLKEFWKSGNFKIFCLQISLCYSYLYLRSKIIHDIVSNQYPRTFFGDSRRDKVKILVNLFLLSTMINRVFYILHFSLIPELLCFLYRLLYCRIVYGFFRELWRTSIFLVWKFRDTYWIIISNSLPLTSFKESNHLFYV